MALRAGFGRADKSLRAWSKAFNSVISNFRQSLPILVLGLTHRQLRPPPRHQTPDRSRQQRQRADHNMARGHIRRLI